MRTLTGARSAFSAINDFYAEMLADTGDSIHELFYEEDLAEIIIAGNYAHSDRRALSTF